jgi:hypothetical protein
MNPCRYAVVALWVLLCCGAFGLSVYADDLETVSTPTGVMGDTVLTNDTIGLAESEISGAADSLPQPAALDTARSVEQNPVAAEEKNAGSLKLVKRAYGKKQVLLATVMMLFVVAIMTAAQQWNPG